MDSCTASTLRTILILVVVIMAAWGVWGAHKGITCAQSTNIKKCTQKSFAITVGVIAVGMGLTTLVIMRANQAEDIMPSTTDLVNNLA